MDYKVLIERLVNIGSTELEAAEILNGMDMNSNAEEARKYLHDLIALKRFGGDSTNRKPQQPISPTLEPAILKVLNMANIEACAVNFLWFPYIPLGKLTLLEGDPGIGKSWAALAIATAVSLGAPLPGDERGINCPVLIASAEDGLSDTIKPRLAAMGADTSQIHAVDGLFTLNDNGFKMLDDAVANTIPGLIIIDPLVAYLSGDMDINKANQARYATSRLAALAEKWNAAVVAIRHLTKGGSQKAIYRGLGSVDFTAAARSVLMAGADQEDSSNKGIVHIKSNLAPTGEAIGYELTKGSEPPFSWKLTSDLTAEKIMANRADSQEGNSIADAEDFLKEMLAPGDLPARDLFYEAKNRGFSTATINRAKARMKIDAYHQGIQGAKGGGKWYWKMPENS